MNKLIFKLQLLFKTRMSLLFDFHFSIMYVSKSQIKVYLWRLLITDFCKFSYFGQFPETLRNPRGGSIDSTKLPLFIYIHIYLENFSKKRHKRYFSFLENFIVCFFYIKFVFKIQIKNPQPHFFIQFHKKVRVRF